MMYSLYAYPTLKVYQAEEQQHSQHVQSTSSATGAILE